MKTLVKKAALDLIQQNQVTTTLEIKEELIRTEPQYYWKQDFISSVMAELADEGEFVYMDNGTFREYRMPFAVNSLFTLPATTLQTQAQTPSALAGYIKIPLSKRNKVKVSLTDLAKLVENNAGKFITLTHTKRTTGMPNTMNCQPLKGLTALGALQVKEQGQLKTIYPTDLLEVRVQGTVYQLN